MHYVKLVATLFAGGFLTSIAEYYLKYSLYDVVKDKVFSLFCKKPVTPVQ